MRAIWPRGGRRVAERSGSAHEAAGFVPAPPDCTGAAGELRSQGGGDLYSRRWTEQEADKAEQSNRAEHTGDAVDRR